jgi:hypothetical protein
VQLVEKEAHKLETGKELYDLASTQTGQMSTPNWRVRARSEVFIHTA